MSSRKTQTGGKGARKKPAKQAAAKKSARKKAAKKAASKKPARRKVAKKVAAKKPARKKTAKKVAAKKPARKKTVAKQAAADKPARKNAGAESPPESSADAHGIDQQIQVDSGARAPVVLDSRLCIRGVGALAADLESRLAGDTDLVIDASQVESIDAAALQLLVAFSNSAKQAARAVEWQTGDGQLPLQLELAGLGTAIDFSAPTDGADDGLCPVF